LTCALSKTTFTLYSEVKVSWQGAVEFCRSLGEELIRITSQDVSDFLSSAMDKGGVWDTNG
jgi:hypothetical protein